MEMVAFEQIEVGQEFGPLTKEPVDKTLLVKYCGVAQDYHLIHTDDELARKDGLPGVVAHGMLSMGYIGQIVGKIVGTNGFVKRLQVRFVGMVFVGDVVSAYAKVTKINVKDNTVDLEVYATLKSGKVVTNGEATLKYY